MLILFCNSLLAKYSIMVGCALAHSMNFFQAGGIGFSRMRAGRPDCRGSVPRRRVHTGRVSAGKQTEQYGYVSS
jgi:hypothetical protein